MSWRLEPPKPNFFGKCLEIALPVYPRRGVTAVSKVQGQNRHAVYVFLFFFVILFILLSRAERVGDWLVYYFLVVCIFTFARYIASDV